MTKKEALKILKNGGEIAFTRRTYNDFFAIYDNNGKKIDYIQKNTFWSLFDKLAATARVQLHENSLNFTQWYEISEVYKNDEKCELGKGSATL